MTGTDVACLHTNQSRSYLNHLVYDSQESFCEELEQPFDQFPKHHIKFCYESSVQHYKDLINVEVEITVPSPNVGK